VRFGRRILLLALAGGAPALAVLLLILFLGDHSAKVRWTAVVLVGGWWLAFGFVAMERVVRPLQTIANMIAGCAKTISRSAPAAPATRTTWASRSSS
jgi:hypothetical protein